jgi:hypothetical protein
LKQAVIKALTVPDHDRFFDIVIEFQDRWNLPNDISCIVGMHIYIKYLPKAGSLFYSYSFFYIVLQDVADSEADPFLQT